MGTRRSAVNTSLNRVQTHPSVPTCVVFDRSVQVPCTRWCRRRAPVAALNLVGDTKVHQLGDDMRWVIHDVARRDVTMHDAMVMPRRKSNAAFVHQRQRFIHLERPVASM